MLQISNVDDGKSEWNINETHIIIPMIDGDLTNKESDKILTSTLTLNSLEGGDQAILTNALEHSLVIGLDKNLFETPSYKSDLVIIQNSDLKVLTCNTDLKTPVTYTLTYVDQENSDILWQAPMPKDRICVSDKGILEVRDVLNYDESVHELEKSEPQISLDSIDSQIASQVTKTEILTGDRKCGQKKESQFINYNSSSGNTGAESILPHLDASKLIENVGVVENKKLFENKLSSEPSAVSSTYKRDAVKNILSVTEPVQEINESVPVEFVKDIKQKTEKKTTITQNKDTKDEKTKGKLKIECVSNFLPEKSLPLKKKAKMKRTVTSLGSENRVSLLKQDVAAASHTNMKFPAAKKTKSPLTSTNLQDVQDPCSSSSSEPSLNKDRKRKKATKLNTNPKKLQKSVPDDSTSVEDDKSKKLTSNSTGEESGIKINNCTFDENKFNSIHDLVECLRKCQLINSAVWHTLHSGLKEMKVDILKEMNARIKETYSPKRTHYSPQLKAFALVLYFKQPAAFNLLSQVYKTGWPSLDVIKEWKRQMNSQQRPNFIRAKRETDNSKS